jgi:phospholipase/carboxylesterase
MPILETIEINPIQPATHSVIWLHGLGADGHDFAGIVPELNLPAKMAMRFILPHAPMRPVTLNNGMTMRAWYDIYGLSASAREDEDGIRQVALLINELIEQEHARGVAYEKIVLAGFSQGGALALYCGLCFPEKLAGILALSAYLPVANLLYKEASPANKSTPIFMAHGLYDPVVPLLFGQGSYGLLKTQGYQVDWRTYPMQHAVCLEEIRDISTWLQERAKV